MHESVGSTDGQQPTVSTDERQHGPLLLALAYLLKGTPANLSRADMPRILGLLLTALDVLQLPGQCRDKGLLKGALQSVQAVMKEPTGVCMHLITAAVLIWYRFYRNTTIEEHHSFNSMCCRCMSNAAMGCSSLYLAKMCCITEEVM